MAGISEELRQAVLQAAIQGKLTQQLPDDGDARDLLAHIKAEKEHLIKEKKIKKEKPMEPINEDDIPFEIPENWVWCRWGTLSYSIQYGYNAPALQTGNARMVRISDIQNNSILWDSVPFCEIKETDIASYQLSDTNILFARTGGTVGKSVIVQDMPFDVPYVYAGYLIRTNYHKDLFPQYLKFFMDSELYWSQLRDGTTKNAQPNCNGQTLSKMIIPLPPLAEQQRIVARVEELMAKIDELEKIENELNALHKAFPGDMKAALLQAAMQGKLTEQLPEDGNAKDLLAQIREEKEKLIKAKKIKKEKALEPISEDDVPFEIPENWCWTTLEYDTNTIPAKTYQIKESEILEFGRFPVVSQSQLFVSGYCDIEDKVYHVKTPIVLFGDHTTIVKIIDFDFVVGADGTKLLECKDFIIPRYLYYVLIFNSMGMEKMGGYSRHYKYLKEKHIPLPPLSEQHRIVEKLDKLLPLCDALEANL